MIRLKKIAIIMTLIAAVLWCYGLGSVSFFGGQGPYVGEAILFGFIIIQLAVLVWLAVFINWLSSRKSRG